MANLAWPTVKLSTAAMRLLGTADSVDPISSCPVIGLKHHTAVVREPVIGT